MMMMPPVANCSQGSESSSKQHAPPPPPPAKPASGYRPTDDGDEFVPVVVSPDRGQPYHRSSFRSLARIPEEPSWPGCSNKPNNDNEAEAEGGRTPNHISNFYYCHPSRKKKHKLLSSSGSSEDLQQKNNHSDDSVVCSSSSTSCSPPPLFASDSEVLMNPTVANTRQQQSQLFDAGVVPGHFVHKPKAAPAALTAPRTPAATAVVPHVLHLPVNDKATSSLPVVPTTPEQQTPPRTTTEATSSLLEPPPLIPNHHDYYYYHLQGTGATMAAGGDGAFHQHSSNRAFLLNLPKNHHDHRRPPSVKVNDTTPSLPFLDDMSSCHDHDEKDDDKDNDDDDDDCRELASLSPSPRILQKRSSGSGSSSTANSHPPLLLPPCLAIL